MAAFGLGTMPAMIMTGLGAAKLTQIMRRKSARVGLGLLIGSVAGSGPSGKMMGLTLMLPLLLPVALLMARGLFPESVLAVFDLVPTVAMSALVRASFSASVTLADVGSELALVVVSAVVVLALVVRLVRRSDR